MDRKYLGVAETAKLVRAALRESFPSVKFSVRSSSYSGGASIRVAWLDGPTSDQVKAIAGVFEGAYFDGMIDYKGSRYHTLDGQPVRFAADYVFADRSYSDAFVARGIAQVVAEFGGAEPISVEGYRNGAALNWYNSGRVDLGRELNVFLSGNVDEAFALSLPSPTLARVAFEGDDGYGQGTVGMPGGRGGDQAYVAQEQARERAAAAREAQAEIDSAAALLVRLATGQSFLIRAGGAA